MDYEFLSKTFAFCFIIIGYLIRVCVSFLSDDLCELETYIPVFMVAPSLNSRVQSPVGLMTLKKVTFRYRFGLGVRGNVVAPNFHKSSALVTCFTIREAYVMFIFYNTEFFFKE